MVTLIGIVLMFVIITFVILNTQKEEKKVNEINREVNKTKGYYGESRFGSKPPRSPPTDD